MKKPVAGCYFDSKLVNINECTNSSRGFEGILEYIACFDENLRSTNYIIMSRIEFNKELDSLKKDLSPEIFSPVDVANKIACLLAPGPLGPKKDIVRW